MACIRYKPVRSLTTTGANIFACDDYRDLCFKMSTPNMQLEQQKNEQKTMSGRPCIDKEKEDCLVVTITAINLHTKDKPCWIEFIRSTGCGEEVLVPRSLMPCLASMGVSERAVITGTPTMNIISRKLFQVSFKLRFWEWI